MKLIFPNGEHAPVALAEGVTRVGAAADCTLVLAAPGVAQHHSEIEMRAGQVVVRPLDAASPTVLNGRQITQESPLKPGDLLLFGRIGCRVTTADRPAVATIPPPARKAAGEDARTRVRMTLPKYMLRGVSGATFGKTYALTGTMVIGRQSDSDIAIPAEEISRHHARLQVTPEGVLVEDMGSANGTFINDKRVQTGVLKPGEELRLDTVRFLLVAPGTDARAQGQPAARTEAPASVPSASGGGKAIGIIVAIVIVAVVAFAALRYFGVV